MSQNPVLEHIDLAIIQIDADVAGQDYADANIANPVRNDLPCALPCPPAGDTVAALKNVVCGWLEPSWPGSKAVICIPSKCTEAWVVAALYGPNDPELVQDLECSDDVVSYLQRKPVRERLVKMQFQPGRASRQRKIKAKYQQAQRRITSSWSFVCQACPQAQAFQDEVARVSILPGHRNREKSWQSEISH